MEDAKDDHGVVRESMKNRISTRGRYPRSSAEICARRANTRKVTQQLNHVKDSFDHCLSDTPACDVDEMVANIDYVLLHWRQNNDLHDLLAMLGKPGANACHGFESWRAFAPFEGRISFIHQRRCPGQVDRL